MLKTLLASIIGSGFVGIGLGIAYRAGASSGGFDIVFILLNKYKKMNFLEKIWFNLFDSYGKTKLDCSKINSRCLCPDVYYLSNIDFKKNILNIENERRNLLI